MKYLYALLAVTLMALMTISPAGADVGDGKEGCNRGEICVEDWKNSARIKHFWWNKTYGATKWWNKDLDVNQEKVKDDIGYVIVKDNNCDVKFTNVKRFQRDDNWTVPNDFRGRNAKHNNRYDKHARVNC